MPNKVLFKTPLYLDKAVDEPRSRSRCSIARRMLEADPDICNIDVTPTTVAFSRYSTGRRYYFYLPENAQDFIQLLDKGKTPPMTMLILRESDLRNETFNDVGWGWNKHAIDPGSQPDRADRTRRPTPAV